MSLSKDEALGMARLAIRGWGDRASLIGPIEIEENDNGLEAVEDCFLRMCSDNYLSGKSLPTLMFFLFEDLRPEKNDKYILALDIKDLYRTKKSQMLMVAIARMVRKHLRASFTCLSKTSNAVYYQNDREGVDCSTEDMETYSETKNIPKSIEVVSMTFDFRDKDTPPRLVLFKISDSGLVDLESRDEIFGPFDVKLSENARIARLFLDQKRITN